MYAGKRNSEPCGCHEPVQQSRVLPQLVDVLVRRISQILLLREDGGIATLAELHDLRNLVHDLAGVLIDALVVVDAQDFTAIVAVELEQQAEIAAFEVAKEHLGLDRLQLHAVGVIDNTDEKFGRFNDVHIASPLHSTSSAEGVSDSTLQWRILAAASNCRTAYNSRIPCSRKYSFRSFLEN